MTAYRRAMPRSRPFNLPETAPRDGSVIEVRHGAQQGISTARWSAINQAFINLDDPFRRTLGGVTGWRRLDIQAAAFVDAGQACVRWTD
jgi:hypothetical protein